MKRAPLFVAALFLLCSGCASGKGGTRTNTDRTVITRAQLQQNNFTNAYDAVASLHSNWLQKRGTDSFLAPGEILVYVDEVRFGGIETLRSLASSSIGSIRFFDGIAASNRWGVGHGNGVILVSSRAGQ